MAADYSILDKFQGLRVTDVCDGMDALGMQDIGLVDRSIRPLWRDIENFSHRVYGLAHTVRFVPTNRKKPDYKPEGFDEFKSWGYSLARGPFTDQIKKGDMIVIDGQDIGSVGFIGSNNGFSWIAAGAVGAITNGGCRDTDELIKQKVPVYSRYISRTIRPARLELDTTNVPVNIGGALIRPGDVVVADGDGVVCVPIEVAEDVAKWAWHVAKGDKEGRRKIYDKMGMEPDWTVEV
jgi:regulator of RNase E activity RraA